LHDDGHGLDDDQRREAMGFTLPGAASIPAPDSRHARMATETGKRIVDMVWEDL
jgi:dihydroxyacid dehydratase/phosphogluconate dehydratase